MRLSLESQKHIHVRHTGTSEAPGVDSWSRSRPEENGAIHTITKMAVAMMIDIRYGLN